MPKIKALVADDSMLMRDIIKESLLESFPEAEIYESGNGKDVQKILLKEVVDIVLCDWEMPEMSGLDVLKWVRSTPNLNTLPFIMITGTTDKEHVVECIKSGVTDYIVKPLTPDMLCNKISKALKIKA
ncbi:MAG: response regulator [Nitrospirae bacterium]|nr:MAG: response regulator [Nitrospirota bacterium]